MDIQGYRASDPTLPPSPVTPGDFDRMKAACLFGANDLAALRRPQGILAPQVERILDVWYGFVGSNAVLLDAFVDPRSGQPVGASLDRVRARFGEWILDTADAEHDEKWLGVRPTSTPCKTPGGRP